MKTLLCSVLVTLLCGCSVVHSQQPVGLTPKNISNEVDEWEGVWKDSEKTSCAVFVKDAKNGLLRVIQIDNDDDSEQESFDLHLREANKWTFASMADEDSEEGLFVWGRIKMEDGVVLVWTPNVEKITALIEAGTLPGTTNKNGATLGPLSTNHYDIICSDSKNVLFEWDEPMVFWRMSK